MVRLAVDRPHCGCGGQRQACGSAALCRRVGSRWRGGHFDLDLAESAFQLRNRAALRFRRRTEGPSVHGDFPWRRRGSGRHDRRAAQGRPRASHKSGPARIFSTPVAGKYPARFRACFGRGRIIRLSRSPQAAAHFAAANHGAVAAGAIDFFSHRARDGKRSPKNDGPGHDEAGRGRRRNAARRRRLQ